MDKLPDELGKLEEELMNVCREKPSKEFRDRLLMTLEKELVVELPPATERSRWAFAAAVALSVLIWMNLSISATNSIGRHGQVAWSASEIDQVVADLHELLPELSSSQTRRYAMLLQARDTLLLMPELPPSTFFQQAGGGIDRGAE